MPIREGERESQMTWDKQDSHDIYEELRKVSATILGRIGCHPEPHRVGGRGKTRTASWRFSNGKRKYKGILYHYTAGVSTIGAMRWANHPGWGNTGSSWHATIADRMLDNAVGEEWSKVDDELRRLFPVPTIIMASFNWGTWHGNWTCDVTLGVENRNSGYWGYGKAEGGLAGLGKKGVKVGTRTWEEYTREQIVCNVNFGRMANGMIGGTLDPDWVLSHQCVYARKSDCGPAYPMHDIRNAIFVDTPIDELIWLAHHPMAPDVNEDDDSFWEELDGARAENIDNFVQWVKPTKAVIDQEKDPAWIAGQLYRLGFNTGPEAPYIEDLRKQVRWFQRSTSAYRKKNPEWVLKPDGIAGPKTEEALKRRMIQMGID